MKKISREEAESLFTTSEVLNTKIEQDKNHLSVIMTLSDHRVCHVTYDFKSRQKSYHLQDAQNIINGLPVMDP